MNGGSNDNQPRARSAGSGPTRETVILEAVHLYLEGTVAAAIMAMLGVSRWSGHARVERRSAPCARRRCRCVHADGDRPDSAPVAHDESTGPSRSAARLTGCRTAPARSVAWPHLPLVEGAPTRQVYRHGPAMAMHVLRGLEVHGRTPHQLWLAGAARLRARRFAGSGQGAIAASSAPHVRAYRGDLGYRRRARQGPSGRHPRCCRQSQPRLALLLLFQGRSR